MKKNGKLTLAVLAAGIILTTIVRFLVITKHTEMTTGFLYHGDEPLWNGLYYGAVLLISIAAIFTSIVGKNDDPEPLAASEIGKGRTIVIGLFTMLSALLAAYEGLDEMHAFTPTKLLIAADLVFAVIMAVIAFVTLYRKSFSPVIGYLYSLIGAYCICRGIYCFMSRMAISTVPEYIIECLSVITMAIYFVLLGRFLSGNDTKRTKSAMSFWGVGAASLTFSSAIAPLAAKFIAPVEIGSRIVYTAAAAESYRQASAGFDAYKMVIAPWVNIALGALIAASLVIAFTEPSDSN